MKVGHKIGSSLPKSAQEEVEMIPAKEQRQADTWMLSKEECLGHTPWDALETEMANGGHNGCFTNIVQIS